MLAGLGFLGSGMRGEARIAAQRAMRATELRDSIAHLDEMLVMTVRMAAMSGERRWAQRFEEDAPRLDAAIVEADEMVTPEIRTALAETTGEAHRDLLSMERRVLALAADGDLAAARSLLDGPEFGYLQEVYADGLDVFGQSLRALNGTQAADLDARSWMEVVGLSLIAVLVVGTALALRGHLKLRAAKARMDDVARTDLLTDLPNRRHFYEVVGAALAGGETVDHDLAVLLVDLDRFKATNDAHGHPAGDRVLQLAASRLSQILRAGDLLARLDGDEFALLIRTDGETHATESSDAVEMAKRVIMTIGEPFTLDEGTVVRLSASVGVALSWSVDRDVNELMHHAEVALARAKIEGRGCFRSFTPGMDADVRARALLESEFRQAVAEDVILPHFQPLMDVRKGHIVGVEMLARWPHPTRGMVSPADFIPIAEATGLIGPMTVSLLRQGCRAAAAWPPHVTLACNVSPLQLRDPGLPAMIATVLAETGFPAHRLEVEVTESALVGDLAMARQLLDDIKALGIKLALDDFGTGYSSLRHLQALPFDKLKIDASFVGAMAADRESAKIVSAVIGLGHSLGLSTVAEGVETEDVAALLRGLGCDIGQGWLFGRPVPAHRIDALVALGEDERTATVPLVA